MHSTNSTKAAKPGNPSVHVQFDKSSTQCATSRLSELQDRPLQRQWSPRVHTLHKVLAKAKKSEPKAGTPVAKKQKTTHQTVKAPEPLTKEKGDGTPGPLICSDEHVESWSSKKPKEVNSSNYKPSRVDEKAPPGSSPEPSPQVQSPSTPRPIPLHSSDLNNKHALSEIVLDNTSQLPCASQSHLYRFVAQYRPSIRAADEVFKISEYLTYCLIHEPDMAKSIIESSIKIHGTVDDILGQPKEQGRSLTIHLP